MIHPCLGNVILFFLLVNTGCNAQSVEQSNQTTKVFIEVKFSSQGSIVLNYLDSNYHSTNIKLRNSVQRDIVVSKNLHVQGPTVLGVVQKEGDKLFYLSFLTWPGDSLFITLDSKNLMSLSKETSVLDLSTIFGKTEFKQLNQVYGIGSLNFLLDSVKKTYLHNESKIREYSLQKELEQKRIQTLQSYNKLLYYSSLFKVNYETYTPDSIYANTKITKVAKDATSDADIFTHIYSGLSKNIIYYLAQREARISNSPSPDIFVNMKYLPSDFHKKKHFDGYFHDLLLNNENIVTTTQRANIVNKYKHFLFDTTSFITKLAFQKQPIPNEVMDAPLKSLSGSVNKFKNLISSANGKVILIDFWASWCVPCIAEVPHLKKAAEKLKDKITIYSMSIDSDESNWKKATKKYNLLSNSFLLEKFENHQIVKFLQLNAIPRIILINRKGELLESDFLKPSNKNFQITLEDILAQN
ncbi:MAG TPA: TlpA disulfide reductase family protein [Segetibacter sp.]|jgi:thiol-disulfide isomerase/thioredoxin